MIYASYKAGTYGVKLTGVGGGGCIVALVQMKLRGGWLKP